MRNLSSYRKTFGGFAAGVLVGLVVGSAGVATAAFGLKGWNTFSSDFRLGYIAGFIEMSNLARNLDPGGWVDQKYPYLEVEPLEWFAKIDELYKDPQNADYTMTTMMQLAGKELEKTKGKGVTSEERARQRLLAVLEAQRKKQIEEGKLPPEAADRELEPKPLPPKPVTKADENKPKKKWCRCDGRDPKKLREERRAKAAAEEAAKKGVAPAPSAAPAPTPPDAAKQPPPGHAAPPNAGH